MTPEQNLFHSYKGAMVVLTLYLLGHEPPCLTLTSPFWPGGPKGPCQKEKGNKKQ